MGRLHELLARLDSDKVRRGRQFERICKWFLTNDPLYQHQVRRVWLWDEWLGRWGADAGIDLVVEDRERGLWAVQAKAYDPDYSVTKADVDTFLSESSRPEFSYRLLIATTNRVGKTARRTLAGQEKQAGLLLLADLEAAQVDWPWSPAALRPKAPKRKRPRPHQAQAIREVVTGFAAHDRGQMLMACGTGKTLTALFIAERLKAERTLVLAPSLSLLAQILREWTANASEDFDYLPVCSDETVADPDAAVSSTSDLGFPVTTDPEDIARFLRRRSGRRVVFSTYQSSPRIAEAYRVGRVPRLDLALADEAHRCAGRVSSDFATILDAVAIPAKRRLFMTATPRYFTGRVVREAREADFEVASMDDRDTFGPVFHSLSFGEAIERDLLSDYQVAVIGADDATYREWAERGRFVTLDGTAVTDARRLAGQIGVAKAMRRYNLRRTISFHSRVARARDFARTLTEVVAWMPKRQRPKGSLWAQYVSGEMSTGQRTISLERLRHIDGDAVGLLANARCLSEGVDVPTLDGVAFVDPRRSEVDIVQAVGRAIRKAENKTTGTIVIPVFIAAEEDPEAALDASAFKPIWDVIRALRAHDADLAEQLDSLRRELGKGASSVTLPPKIHLDLPDRIGLDFAAAFDVRVVEQTTSTWEFWLGLLERFVAREGHARPPARHTECDFNLGAWVALRRNQRERLSQEQQAQLSDLLGWVWSVHDTQWEDGFRALTEHVAKHGEANVPLGYIDEQGYRLGQWVNGQRKRRKHLDNDQEERLSNLPDWVWNTLDAQWEEGFAALRTFVGREGHILIPFSHVEHGFKLGSWISAQRGRRTRGRLSRSREERLGDLPGWVWNTLDARWEQGFAALAAYVAEQGNAGVRAGHIDAHGYRLGQWAGVQRTTRREGRLSKEREERLSNLSGWHWDSQTAKWDERFAALNAYVTLHGQARVPAEYIDEHGFNLGRWVVSQRATGRKRRLSSDREERLSNLPGWVWNTHDAQWEEGFAALSAYVVRHADAGVDGEYVDEHGYTLGRWVGDQRSRRQQLSRDRHDRLSNLPGWIWDAREAHWEEGFAALTVHLARQGDARVPAEHVDERGFNLGRWVVNQRATRRKGRLSSDRQVRLSNLPGWIWHTQEAQWEEGFDALTAYVKHHGTAHVPDAYIDDQGVKLGSWVGTQRRAKKTGHLPRDRAGRLEALPGWVWDAPRGPRPAFSGAGV